MKYDRCAVNGVFDLFHVGHVRLLKRAKEMFREVVVTIDSDELATQEKRKPVFSQEERLEILKSCRYVDDAVIVDRTWGPHAFDEAAVNDFMDRYKSGISNPLIRIENGICYCTNKALLNSVLMDFMD